MTKEEFLESLTKELRHRNAPDIEDILDEYEQHFAFKLADGYTEEEIAAKLGSPAEIAAQFESGRPAASGARRVLTAIGLGFADLFAGCFFLLLACWGLVMACCVLTFVLMAGCFFAGTGFGYSEVLTYVPYWCGAMYALTLTALAVVTAVGTVYFFALLRQLWRSYGRFHKNALAAASGRSTLPPLGIRPRFKPSTVRKLRTVALVAAILFAVCFVLSMAASMLSAGAFEFWHAWHWFGYGL